MAISLPSAEDLPDDPARPRNLLILWGSAESSRFSEAALAALRAGYPEAEPGQTYGDPGQGTARRAVEIAGAEHISVIYRQQSFEEVAAWLGGGQPRGDARIIGMLLILVGGVLAARPLLALRARVSRPARAPAPRGPSGRCESADPWWSSSGAAAVAGLGAAAPAAADRSRPRGGDRLPAGLVRGRRPRAGPRRGAPARGCGQPARVWSGGGGRWCARPGHGACPPG